MNPMKRLGLAELLVVVAIGALAMLADTVSAGDKGGSKPASAPGPSYTLRPLLPLGNSWAYGVNDSGQVVGLKSGAVVWESPEAAATCLPSGSRAEAINNSGQAVGWGLNGGTHAILWERLDGEWSSLQLPAPVLGFEPHAKATDINNHGQVLGSDLDGWTMLLWQPDDGYTEWTVLPGYWYDKSSSLSAWYVGGCWINDGGQIAGVMWVYDDSGTFLSSLGFLITPEDNDDDGRPDLWFRDDDGDGSNDLQVGLPPLPGGVWCQVSALNSLGQVVGSSQDSDGWYHAVVWQVDELGQVSLTDLGTGKPRCHTYGRDINDLGQVVGESIEWSKDDQYPYIVSRTGLLWQNGKASKLENLIKDTAGLSDLRPYSINNAGAIVGFGSPDAWDGDAQAFIAIPSSAP